MAESSTGWWKLTFLRKKKSQPKVLYEIPQESVSNSATGQHGCSAASEAATQPQDTELEARLGRIVDKTTASRGRHVKVSHSGRFKEKKRVRTMLAENPDMFPGSGPARDENQRAENHPRHGSLKRLKKVTGPQVLEDVSPLIQEASAVLKPTGGESQEGQEKYSNRKSSNCVLLFCRPVSITLGSYYKRYQRIFSRSAS